MTPTEEMEKEVIEKGNSLMQDFLYGGMPEQELYTRLATFVRNAERKRLREVGQTRFIIIRDGKKFYPIPASELEDEK